MITKNRLEELIQKEITFYVVCWGKIKTILPNDLVYMDIEEDTICYEVVDDTPRTTDLGHLFETRKDADWYIEFGRIQRVERLKLPTWEEFIKKPNLPENDIVFKTEGHGYKCYHGFGILYIIKYDEKDRVETIFEKPLTEENYTLACRKCKSLFLGEQNGH